MLKGLQQKCTGTAGGVKHRIRLPYVQAANNVARNGRRRVKLAHRLALPPVQKAVIYTRQNVAANRGKVKARQQQHHHLNRARNELARAI